LVKPSQESVNFNGHPRRRWGGVIHFGVANGTTDDLHWDGAKRTNINALHAGKTGREKGTVPIAQPLQS
jgi:hypothetical protein